MAAPASPPIVVFKIKLTTVDKGNHTNLSEIRGYVGPTPSGTYHNFSGGNDPILRVNTVDGLPVVQTFEVDPRIVTTTSNVGDGLLAGTTTNLGVELGSKRQITQQDRETV